MKKMFRFVSCICLFIILSGTIVHAGTKGPVYAEELVPGTYQIEVSSSSSMFRIIDAQLIVEEEGTMHAVLTLSGKGYEKLYMGTGEEALAAPDTDDIYYIEDSDGKYTYDVPVQALDLETDCAAWSFKRERWYDRVLVFESNTMPKDALIRNGLSMPVIGVISAAAVLLVVCAGFFVWKKRKGRNS